MRQMRRVRNQSVPNRLVSGALRPLRGDRACACRSACEDFLYRGGGFDTGQPLVQTLEGETEFFVIDP